MEKTITKTGYTLENGDRVFVQGYIFTVCDVQLLKGWETTETVVRFKGICTGHAQNSDIMKTSYNGGRYGQLARLPYTCLS